MQIRESSEEGQLSAVGARCLAIKRGRHGMVDQAGTADECFEARNMVGACWCNQQERASNNQNNQNMDSDTVWFLLLASLEAKILFCTLE